jgi:hypothetical protein
VLADETLECARRAREQLSSLLGIEFPDEEFVARQLGSSILRESKNQQPQAAAVPAPATSTKKQQQQQPSTQRGVSPSPAVPLGTRSVQQQQQRRRGSDDDSTLSVEALAREIIMKENNANNVRSQNNSRLEVATKRGTTADDVASPSSESSASTEIHASDTDTVEVKFDPRRSIGTAQQQHHESPNAKVKMTLAQLRRLIAMHQQLQTDDATDQKQQQQQRTASSSSSSRSSSARRRRQQRSSRQKQQPAEFAASSLAQQHSHVPPPSAVGVPVAGKQQQRQPAPQICDVSLTSITSAGAGGGTGGFSSDSSVLWEALTHARARHNSQEMARASRRQ